MNDCGPSADDFKLAPEPPAASGASGSGAFRTRVLATVVAVMLLVLCAVGWLWIRQRPDSAAAHTVDRLTAASPASGETPFAWQSAYRRALAPEGDREGTAKELGDRFADLQRRVRSSKAAEPREETELAELETAWRTLRNRAAVARSAVLEEEAAVLAAEGRRAASLEKLMAALRLQDEANSVAPMGRLKDFQREARLRTAVDMGAARPLRDAIADARGRAESALAEGEAARAVRALREAQAKQLVVNQAFRESKAAAPSAVNGLETEIETLESGELASRLPAAIAAAERASAAQKTEDAGRGWAAAATLQRELNVRFPKSREASLPRANEFEIKRQTVLSRPLLARAAALESQAALALRRQSIEPALGLLDEAVVILDRAAADFPRSVEWDAGLARKIDYLALKRRDLAQIREAAGRSLAGLPGRLSLAMAGTEVSQALFSLVMHANPSRNRGPALPVECVSWHEADEFCQRLSWILGGGVRLPTEAEFRSAPLGARTHGAAMQPAADRPGEAAEWLQPAPGAGALAWIGSRRLGQSAEGASGVSVSSQAKDFRSRLVGFRFVVEPPRPEHVALHQ